MNISELGKRYLAAKRALFDLYYDDLNERQRQAVFCVNNPLLVIAGAGSGKTTVLVRRIAFIIRYGDAYESNVFPFDITEEEVRALENAVHLTKAEIANILPTFTVSPCAPWQMLAITFTNKAANEIKARLAAQFDDGHTADEIWAGTFHSVCVRILHAHAEQIGYPRTFSIYDTDDTKKALQAAMKACNIDEKLLPIKSVMNAISRAKDHLLTPEEYETQNTGDFRLVQIAKIYTAYQKALVSSGAMDFDDIIMQTVRLFREHPDVAALYQRRFSYVCVDEYQDTNVAQFALTSLFAGNTRNLMVVGDDDQSIYRFRGATIENILSFDKTFQDARVIKLEQNYRSTQTILGAANAVIAHNTGRHEKKLWTAKDAGTKIILRKLADNIGEARYIVDEIRRAVASGRSYRDFAVLYRVGAQANSLENVFARSGIPYRILGGLRFSDHKEIRDIVAYLQLLVNANDRERLLRIINEPKRKIGEKTLEAIRLLAAENGTSLFAVMQHADRYVALAKTAPTLVGFCSMIEDLTALSKETELPTLFDIVLDRTGYRRMLEEKPIENAERLSNLEEFKSNIMEYCATTEHPTLAEFLEINALVADVDRYDESADAVVMMTIHSAKGLEFPIVFLPGMEDGIFPGMQTIVASDDEMEEERRLCYVAITRAREQIYLLHTECRTLYASTQFNPISRFISEIPPELLDDDTQASAKSVPFSGYRSTAPARRGTDYSAFFRPAESTPSPNPRANRTAFVAGDRVRHQQFGEGLVLSAKSVASDTILEVAFDSVGTKKLMASFAKLEKC